MDCGSPICLGSLFTSAAVSGPIRLSRLPECYAEWLLEIAVDKAKRMQAIFGESKI